MEFPFYEEESFGNITSSAPAKSSSTPSKSSSTPSKNKPITVIFYPNFKGEGKVSIKSDIDVLYIELKNNNRAPDTITFRITDFLDISFVNAKKNNKMKMFFNYQSLKSLAKGGDNVYFDFKITPDGKASLVTTKKEEKLRKYVQPASQQEGVSIHPLIVILLLVLLGYGAYHFMTKKKTFNQAASMVAFGKKLSKMVKV